MTVRSHRRGVLRRAQRLTALVLGLVMLGILAQAGPARYTAGPTPSTRSAGAGANGDFALKDGDRVLFYGDSITEQRLYTSYVEDYVLTHYPDQHITFTNTGWGGDKVTANDCKPCAGVGGLARIRRDVFDHDPTVVTLLFGMNDGNYQDFDAATMKIYTDGLTAIIHELKAHTKARIFVMTPTVYDGTRHTPWSHTDKYNEVLDRYSQAAKEIASAEGLPVIDLHAATVDALNEAKKLKADYTFLPDGVHPAEDGQLVMAMEILKNWGARVEGVHLSKNVSSADESKFDLAAPLPWPSPVPSPVMNQARPGIMKMGEISLAVSGLSAGMYSVKVDGKEAGEYNADVLAKGIDIGRTSEPAVEQSVAVGDAVRKQADIFFFAWRQIEVAYDGQVKSASKVVASADTLLDELLERTRSQAAFHKYAVEVLAVK